MGGTLFIVGTPIGNLEDITLRALRILGAVDLVAAEDTRRTRHLLTHHGITTPTLSLHEHNERARTPQILERLANGADVALVSDAGMPGLSDPGSHLIREARAAGFRVEVVPGPSAVTAALAGAGLSESLVSFAGFPPARGAERRLWLETVGRLPGAVVFFEAPHRLERTLKEGREAWGDRNVTLARELTKVHEEFVTGPISGMAERQETPKGEYTVVLWPRSDLEALARPQPTDDQVLEIFCYMTKNIRGSRSDVLRTTASKLGISRRQVFDALERVRGNRSHSQK